MFAMVVHGTAAVRDRVRPAWGSVGRQLDTSGTRWLGATGALLPSDDFVAILCFESREAARITMDDLAEASAWRALAEATDGLSFRECPHVRAARLHTSKPVNQLELACGSVPDIGWLIETFERAVRDDQGSVSGLVCWNDEQFAAAAIQGFRPEGSAPSTPSLAAARSGEEVFTQRIGPAVTRPWSVLRLADAP